MIEDELRASFARHEAQAPAVGPLRRAIDRLAARRRRRRRLFRTAGAAAVALVALIAVPLGLRPGPATLMMEPLFPSDAAPAGPVNVLVVGLDPFPEPAGRPRSDTIILVHLPADRHRAYLISFERDLQVDIPGYGPDKINMAYVDGGAALLESVVSKIAGVPVDGTITVDLPALATITDALGGVRICQPVTVTSIHTGRRFDTGCYSLDGKSVTDLVRQRYDYPNGGYGRDATAQRILVGLAKQAVHANLLTDISRLAALLRVDGLDVHLPYSMAVLVALVRNLDPSTVIGLGQPSFDPVGTNERLDPEVAPELFAALRTETLDDFATRHPDWIVNL
jgi:LCP family protein required for cell wall assembly